MSTTTNTVPNSKLPPTKLSDLIQLALDDIDAIEKDPRYVVDMNWWHMPMDVACHVCLAGAVMARSLEVPIDACSYPHYHKGWWAALKALDAVRQGILSSAFFGFYNKCMPEEWPTYVTNHSSNTWRENAIACMDFFREKGY